LASRGRRAYRGINVLILWVSGQMFGYEENTWMTYRQAQDLGGQALKGEEGTLVIKYGTFTAKEHEDDEDRSKYQNELRVEPNRFICSPAWPKSTARH
jgi:antirestriction protein ArdC